MKEIFEQYGRVVTCVVIASMLITIIFTKETGILSRMGIALGESFGSIEGQKMIEHDYRIMEKSKVKEIKINANNIRTGDVVNLKQIIVVKGSNRKKLDFEIGDVCESKSMEEVEVSEEGVVIFDRVGIYLVDVWVGNELYEFRVPVSRSKVDE